MVKTRRSNGENGEVDEGNEAQNDVGSVSDDKPISNWSKRELRSSQYRVTRKIQHWSPKYSRRHSTIKMPRIVFPESDTEPEKYSRRSRQVRVFFAGDEDSTNRSVRIRRNRGPRKNYMEDSEDKPIQQNVRRSCRKRKLLHHSFNESWITNELKVRGYPGLYGLQGSSSSDEFSSADEARKPTKPLTRTNNGPTNTDDDTQSARQTRNSTRFSTKKLNEESESESEDENNQTVIEKKPNVKVESENKMEVEEAEAAIEKPANKSDNERTAQDSESNQGPGRGPARATRPRRARRTKKDDSHETASESDSSDSDSDIVIKRQPRRSNRTRKPKPAFVEIAPRQTRKRAKSFTIRKKPYSLRERKPSRRKTIRAESPSTSTSMSSSDNEEDLNVSVKNKTKGRQKTKSIGEHAERALRDIQPVEVDGSVRFSSVGGLEEHIKCLREMVLFPLMYPELFQKFKTRPAKGVLFHGPPGTGKTLLARALANECGRVGGRKVAFFMRKGADCLKKWVGESERHLKLLFQQANKMKPSIIFFDEIDALAPVRSVRQEQVHTSVVGTLLAEMDGLCDRGEVVVIGATNRLEAVDPALRRAGRFDRELHFAPPHARARADILRIYTRLWEPPPADRTLDYVARVTNGYGGSDLRALCSEAVLKALRRVYPQVYESEHALVIDTNNVEVQEADMLEAIQSLVAAGARTSPIPARALPAHVAPLLQAQVDAAEELLNRTFVLSTRRRLSDNALSQPSVLLLTGPCAETYIAPALLVSLEHCAIKELSMATLHSSLAYTQEQALITTFAECRRAAGGCVLFVREAAALWAALQPAGAALFLQLWRARAAGDATLLLAATATDHSHLPQELQELFPVYKECVYAVREPSAAEVIAFLRPAVAEAPLRPPRAARAVPPPLPRAPPPPPPQESPVELARKKRKEDYKLRELRIFLRDICRKLASNRRFYKFTKPVDLEEVTDYLDIVKQPMDLETMMTKVDMHKYNCAKEFLDDIDLICANALEYNPDRTSSDKQIRHEACSLRDHAHALIEVEMDSDFELECRDIARRRRADGARDDADLPDFIYTASTLQGLSATESKTPTRSQHGGDKDGSQVRRKRRRMNAWSKGLVVKRQKTQKSYNNKDQNSIITDEESKENKPITSTPLPNGTAHASGSSNEESLSDDDTPLRHRVSHDHSDLIFQLNAHGVVKSSVLESPTKSTDKIEKTKTPPKKRNSGHESSSGESEKVIINKSELENILYKNAKALRSIGLEALLDLHAQVAAAGAPYAATRDRARLPADILAVVARYTQRLAKK